MVRPEAPIADSLFFRVALIDWSTLPETIANSHRIVDQRLFAGRGNVERGKGWWAGRIADLIGFPRSADEIEVEVLKTRCGDRERWTRRFGARRFQSELRVVDGRMRERFGPMQFELDLQVVDGALHFPVRRGWLLGIPMARCLLPCSTSREYVEDGRFHFDVALDGPLGIGRLVRYRGWLAPVDGFDADRSSRCSGASV